jgi:hypothetical protein
MNRPPPDLLRLAVYALTLTNDLAAFCHPDPFDFAQGRLRGRAERNEVKRSAEA